MLIKRKTLVSELPVGILLAVWALLYLPHLRTSPPWYGDETIAVLLAKNLMRGELALGAVFNTFLTAVYQPLYLTFIGGGLSLTGDIWGTRFVNAVFALLAALSLWFLGRRVFPSPVAFGGALFFLCYDQSIIHFRQTFPHNGVCLGAAIAVLAVCLPSAGWRGRWLAGAGVAIALGSHPLGIYVAITCGLCRIDRPRTWPALILPSLVMIAVTYGIVILRFGWWLWDDLWILAGSYSSYGKENGWRLIGNLFHFYSQDGFHLLGFVGCLAMLLLPGRRRRIPVVLFFVILSLALFSTRSNLTVFYYQAVPLIPFLALGMAFALDFLLRMLVRFVPAIRSVWASHLSFRWLVPPAALFLVLPVLGNVVSGSLQPRNYPWVTQSTNEVVEAAAWLNGHTKPEDLIIANSNIAWLLNSRTADLFQWTSWDGLRTFMYLTPIPHERFRFSLEAGNIRYLVLGDIDIRWGIHQQNISATLARHGVSSWPVVWRGRNYFILENPAFKPFPAPGGER